MPDQKPPRLVAGERETVLALLQYQRESFVRKVTGVDEDTARRQFVPSGTTLLWLMKHMAGAETLWIVHRFAGEDFAGVDDAVQPGDTLAAAIDDVSSDMGARRRGGRGRREPRRGVPACR